MHKSLTVFLINDDARAVRVQYEEGGNLTTAKTLDQELAIDDFVVVQSTTRHGMTVAKIVAVDLDIDFESATDIKWVVQKIDKDGFNDILALEGQAIATVGAAERRRKRDELKTSLFADHQEQIKQLGLAKTADDAVTE